LPTKGRQTGTPYKPVLPPRFKAAIWTILQRVRSRFL